LSPVASVRGVRKVYTKGVFRKRFIRALQTVTLEVPEKGLISLVGESGSGKTTLGKILVGLVMPSSGELSWLGTTVFKDGRVVRRDFYLANRHRFVYVHQDPYSSLNPSKNVKSILEPVVRKYKRHLSEADRLRYIKELLEEVGLVPAEYFIDKYPHHLSGGMRQRLSLARALVVDPYLVIADEVVSMVDPSIRVSLINLLKGVVESRGTSVVFISHDLGAAVYAAGDNPMYVMFRGLVLEFGPATEVIYRPEHPYTRALISNVPVPIALAERRVRELEGVVETPTGNSTVTSPCPFAPMCPLVDAECSTLNPGDYVRVGPNHYSLCVKAGRLPKWRPGWLPTVSG
jgi:oligopeptide/dipeptide ABC transporter ATP-binding protein